MFIVPFVDRVHRVSLRIITMTIQSRGIITKDKRQHLAVVAHYSGKDPIRSVIAIKSVAGAINQPS